MLVLSDIHLPYHDRTAVQTALEYGRDHKADLILLNGDIADCFSISRWETDPRERDFAGEVQFVRDFLGLVRNLFPRARIIYKLGNHEERWIRYMRLKAPELLGLGELDFNTVFWLDRFKIELVDTSAPIKVGELNFLHGHEYRFAISNPVNPARGLFLRAKTHTACGHFHQVSQHSGRSLDDKLTSCWSTGCLCDLHPAYRPLNEWCHGFMFAEVDKAGAFDVQNRRVFGNKSYP